MKYSYDSSSLTSKIFYLRFYAVKIRIIRFKHSQNSNIFWIFIRKLLSISFALHHILFKIQSYVTVVKISMNTLETTEILLEL